MLFKKGVIFSKATEKSESSKKKISVLSRKKSRQLKRDMTVKNNTKKKKICEIKH